MQKRFPDRRLRHLTALSGTAVTVGLVTEAIENVALPELQDGSAH
jgi:hypothetical protein